MPQPSVSHDLNIITFNTWLYTIPYMLYLTSFWGYLSPNPTLPPISPPPHSFSFFFPYRSFWPRPQHSFVCLHLLMWLSFSHLASRHSFSFFFFFSPLIGVLGIDHIILFSVACSMVIFAYINATFFFQGLSRLPNSILRLLGAAIPVSKWSLKSFIICHNFLTFGFL